MEYLGNISVQSDDSVRAIFREAREQDRLKNSRDMVLKLDETNLSEKE